VLWAVVAVAVVVLLGIAIAVNQRHQKDLISTLVALVGRRLTLGVSSRGSQIVRVARFVGVIDAIDPATRWVTFAWIESDEVDGAAAEFAASLMPHLSENGVIADRIYWVEDDTGRRIRLTYVLQRTHTCRSVCLARVRVVNASIDRSRRSS
jgi:hypothetical protein